MADEPRGDDTRAGEAEPLPPAPFEQPISLLGYKCGWIWQARDRPYPVATFGDLLRLVKRAAWWFDDARRPSDDRTRPLMVAEFADIHAERLALTPGARRLILYCNREWGEDLTPENLRKIQGRLGADADALPLQSVADRLEDRQPATPMPMPMPNDALVCHQADVARFKGRSIHTSGLLDRLAQEGVLIVERVSAKKWRVRFRDDREHEAFLAKMDALRRAT